MIPVIISRAVLAAVVREVGVIIVIVETVVKWNSRGLVAITVTLLFLAVEVTVVTVVIRPKSSNNCNYDNSIIITNSFNVYLPIDFDSPMRIN